MKKFTNNLLFKPVALALSVLLLGSCDKNDDDKTPEAEYRTGVFVTNEGSFQTPTGTISFLKASTGSMHNNIFKQVNNRPMGDVAQSMAFYQDKAYLVANNSNKIEIVNALTFKSVGVIENLVYPRYFVAFGNKGYVTEWLDYDVAGQVSVIDLSTNTIIKKIAVDPNPEQMLVHEGKVYVTCSSTNTLKVIDSATDAVTATITVQDAPNSLVMDAAQNIWVLCGGKVLYNADWSLDTVNSTAGSLVKFNSAAPGAQTVIPFSTNKLHPSRLTTNGTKTKLYYTLNQLNYQGRIYEMAVSATGIPDAPLINQQVYGLGVDPATNTIYGGKPGSFTDNGWMVRYTAAGAPVDSFKVGIGPNGFYFR
ncbi:MAG: hypothetical protein LPK19_13485 [Hymenobacteraceae bacterium]|nr:hypothetical protein [Hymenobacteraceae bacterium]MDX5397240.1 hypothetical protein [Hymenobacteraceae bacterium]MDX5513316.1 hypothetical protein [Hymenobacteraceae bacterium]